MISGDIETIQDCATLAEGMEEEPLPQPSMYDTEGSLSPPPILSRPLRLPSRLLAQPAALRPGSRLQKPSSRPLPASSPGVLPHADRRSRRLCAQPASPRPCPGCAAHRDPRSLPGDAGRAAHRGSQPSAARPHGDQHDGSHADRQRSGRTATRRAGAGSAVRGKARE